MVEGKTATQSQGAYDTDASYQYKYIEYGVWNTESSGYGTCKILIIEGNNDDALSHRSAAHSAL